MLVEILSVQILMVKIQDSKPKQSTGNYERLFANKQLGDLITKIQSAVISGGTELERIILAKLKEQGCLIEDLDNFINTYQYKMHGLFVITKKAFKQSKLLDFPSQEPDLVVINNTELNSQLNIIELKDGYIFDTKKTDGEQNSMQEFENFIAKKLPFTTQIFVCAFNCNDKNKIYTGFKGRFTINQILTGEEFCNMLNIDYQSILQHRDADAEANLQYFVMELMKIKEVADIVKDIG
jgi:hypothetical protein